jgi:uncharacterized protein (TIGR00730 family)
VKRICVFCGSSAGRQAAYADVARALGAELVRRGLGLVYGGGSVGLMGTLAGAVLAEGGEAIGVLPRGLARKEYAHDGLTELHLVGSMHERKALMATLSDGFVALPGGLGTLEEVFEVLTWSQLGIHRKPVGLVNVEGYWDGLLTLLRHAVEEGFIRSEYAALLLVDSTPAALLGRFLAWRPPVAPPIWLDSTQT